MGDKRVGESSSADRFSLNGAVVVITGGAGLLGREHALAIIETGGVPVLWDIDESKVFQVAEEITRKTGGACIAQVVDITDEEAVRRAVQEVGQEVGQPGILINNAANDPKVSSQLDARWSRLENLPLDVWAQDIAVGLTGAFICTRILGEGMARRGTGVILNIASDLGLVAPDQRLYRQEGADEDEQPVKPVTYSVVKHGLIGLTRYAATYWAERGVRCNALAPGGVLAGQPAAFLGEVESRIPMARLAQPSEYRGAVQFLVSDASSYMTGAVVVADGGRTVW